MPDWLVLIVAGLAAFRLTSIIHSEKIAAPFRRLFGITEEYDHGVVQDFVVVYPDTFFGHLMECFWCVSVWVSFGVFVAACVAPIALVPFAISALAILFRKLAD